MNGLKRRIVMAYILPLSLALMLCGLYSMQTEAKGPGATSSPGTGVVNYGSTSTSSSAAASSGGKSASTKIATPLACLLKHQPTGSGKLQSDGTYKYPTDDPHIFDIWNPKTREWREWKPSPQSGNTYDVDPNLGKKDITQQAKDLVKPFVPQVPGFTAPGPAIPQPHNIER